MSDLVFFDDLKSIKEIAPRLDSDEIIIAKRFKDNKELEELKNKIKKEKFKFRTCHVMERRNAKELNKFKGRADFIAVLGNSPDSSKFAVSTKGISFLLQPCSSGKNIFDIGIARIAAENDVAIAFLFRDFLGARPFQRSLLFKNASFVLKLAKKFGAKTTFFSGAGSIEEMRSPDDLASLGKMLEDRK